MAHIKLHSEDTALNLHSWTNSPARSPYASAILQENTEWVRIMSRFKEIINLSEAVAAIKSTYKKPKMYKQAWRLLQYWVLRKICAALFIKS
jgi:hypothetical protein